MGDSLRKLILNWYKFLAKDAYKSKPEIFDVLSSMVVDHVTTLYYIRPPSYIYPATWFIALVGPQGKGKSTIMDLTEELYQWAGMEKASEGSPEAIIEDIHNKVEKLGFARLYLFWDEAGRLREGQKSYLSTLEYWVNQMYHSRGLRHRTRTRQEVLVKGNTYMINLVFGAIHTQWAEIEEQFNKGFGRRTLPIYLDPDIPLITDIDFSAILHRAEMEPRLEWIMKVLSEYMVIAGIDKAGRWDNLIKKLTIPEVKKMAIGEYSFKYALGRFLGESIEVPEWEEIEKNEQQAEEWVLEKLKDNLEKWTVEYTLKLKDSKTLWQNTLVKMTTKNNPHNPQPCPHSKGLLSLLPSLPYPHNRLSLLIFESVWGYEGLKNYEGYEGYEGYETANEGSVQTSDSIKNLRPMSSNVHPKGFGVRWGYEGYEKFIDIVTKNPDKLVTIPSGSPTLETYMLPYSIFTAIHILAKVMMLPIGGPSEDIINLKYRIQEALKDLDVPVITYTKFINKVFHTKDTGRYEKEIQLAEEAGIIRILEMSSKRRGRPIRYVVLDTSAKICGNCEFFRSKECPRILNAIMEKGKDWLAYDSVKPWEAPCEKFINYLTLEGGE